MDTPERIAKLEAQMEMIKDDVSELKSDVKDLHSRITTGNREIMDKIESMGESLDKKLNESAISSYQQHLNIENTVRKDIDELQNKITTIEKWKWMIVGGAIVIGYIVGNLDPITKLFGN